MTEFPKVRNDNGTAMVSLPKGDLRVDELIDDDGNPIPSQARVDRIGPKTFKVQILD